MLVVVLPSRAEEEDEAGAALEASSFTESGLCAAGWEEKNLLSLGKEEEGDGSVARLLGWFRPPSRDEY